MFTQRGKRPRIANKILNKNKVGKLTLKTFYKATVINAVCHWQKNSKTDQWIKIGNPETDPYTIYSQQRSKGNTMEQR